jgi:hypothetical protein
LADAAAMAALISLRCVLALPCRGHRRGEGILPFAGGAVDQLVPIVDVKLERDDVGPLGELAQEGFGGRAGIAALGGEELHHGRPFGSLAGLDPGESGEERCQGDRAGGCPGKHDRASFAGLMAAARAEPNASRRG